MPRGYADMGQGAGELLGTLMGGKKLREAGRQYQLEDNLNYDTGSAELEKLRLGNNAERTSQNMTWEDLARSAVSDPRSVEMMRAFEQSGGQNYGSKPHMAEGFNGPESMGQDVVMQPPPSGDQSIIKQLQLALNLHRSGVPDNLLNTSRDIGLEGEMRSGSVDPSSVRSWRSALAGRSGTEGGADAPPGFSVPAWEMLKRIGNSNGAAAFMLAYKNAPAGIGEEQRIMSSLNAAKFQLDQSELLGIVEGDPMNALYNLGRGGTVEDVRDMAREHALKVRAASQGKASANSPEEARRRVDFIYDPETKKMVPAR